MRSTIMDAQPHLPPDTAAHQYEWVLKRNCSLSPRQLGLAYAALLLASFSVAALFTVRGAWYVPVFSLLEMSAVALAFLVYARHATDHEHLLLTDGRLLVELVQGGRIRQTWLDTCWLQVAAPAHARHLITLEAPGVNVEVGRFITEASRRQLVRELRQELRRASQCSALRPA